MADGASVPEGTRCHFLELSGELRNEIYEYARVDEITVDIERPGDKHAELANGLSSSRSLLATCRQIRQDFKSIAPRPPTACIRISAMERLHDGNDSKSDRMIARIRKLARTRLLQHTPTRFFLGQAKCAVGLHRDNLSLWYAISHTLGTIDEERRALGGNMTFFYDLKLQNGSTARYAFTFDRLAALQTLKHGTSLDGTEGVLNTAETSLLRQISSMILGALRNCGY